MDCEIFECSCEADKCLDARSCAPEAACMTFDCGEGHERTVTGGCNVAVCSSDKCEVEATCAALFCGAGRVKLSLKGCNDVACSGEGC